MRESIITLVWLVLFTLCSLPLQGGESFCAITVVVFAEDGNLMSGGMVRLIDPSGRVVQETSIQEGKGRFCDFEFGPHTIEVHQACGSVLIKDIRVEYGREQVIRVLMNTLPGCGDGESTGCFTYFRVRSASGDALGDVKIRTVRSHVATTDAYGRALVAVPSGAHGKYTFSKPGYASQTVDLACPHAETAVNEKYIALNPDK